MGGTIVGRAGAAGGCGTPGRASGCGGSGGWGTCGGVGGRAAGWAGQVGAPGAGTVTGLRHLGHGPVFPANSGDAVIGCPQAVHWNWITAGV